MAGNKELQKWIQLYQQKSGEVEIDMDKVLDFALKHGFELPRPKSPRDLALKSFRRAAREAMGVDEKTGKPFRRYHAYLQKHGDQLHFFWVDIDQASRAQMHKSLTLRREQMVGDALQISYDEDRWNGRNPEAEQIEMDLDFTLDVMWRKAADNDDDEAA